MRGRVVLGVLLSIVAVTPAAAKPRKKKHHSHHHRKKPPVVEPTEPEIEITFEPASADPATSLVMGEYAAVPDAPRPQMPLDVSEPAPTVRRSHRAGPGWFFALRGGPSVIDRRGFYAYQSNRQIYDTERNARGELDIGHYIGRHVALGLAVGAGPFPKFDDLDPLFNEITRFEVMPAQARLELELHAGPLVLAVGGGGAYEQASGSFTTQDPITLEVTRHDIAFKRYGAVGAAHVGLQLQVGHVGIELLAGASAIKLGRGTYEHGMSSPGPSDREMCYEASVLLGLRVQ